LSGGAATFSGGDRDFDGLRNGERRACSETSSGAGGAGRISATSANRIARIGGGRSAVATGNFIISGEVVFGVVTVAAETISSIAGQVGGTDVDGTGESGGLRPNSVEVETICINGN